MPITGITPKTFVLYETSIPASADDLTTFKTSTLAVGAGVVAFSFNGTTNDPPEPGDVTLPTPVRGVGHRQRYGITARHIRLTRVTGTAPNQGRIYRIVPILSNSLFQTILASLGGAAAATYESTDDWDITGIIAETYGI